jgi:hypothetical protein
MPPLPWCTHTNSPAAHHHTRTRTHACTHARLALKAVRHSELQGKMNSEWSWLAYMHALHSPLVCRCSRYRTGSPCLLPNVRPDTKHLPVVLECSCSTHSIVSALSMKDIRMYNLSCTLFMRGTACVLVGCMSNATHPPTGTKHASCVRGMC